MYPVKQSTALTVPFFAHDANGDAVTGLTDGSFTKRISKNGAAFGAMTVTITELENGWYSIPLSTSHSDTLGLLSITFTNAGAKQVNLQYRIHAQLPDDLMATYTQPTGFLAATFPTGTIANTTNVTAGVITTVTTLTNLPAITADWLTAAGTAADFTTEIQVGLATSAAQTTAQNDLNIITGASGVVIAAADIVAGALNGKGDWNTVTPDAAGVAPTAAENATQVWEELTATARTAGTYGQLVKDDINATISSRMATTHLNATTGKLDGVALADTVTTYTGNTLQTGDVATLITTVGAAGVGLTDLGGMSTTMKAQVQTEADASLVTYDAPTNTEFEVRTPTAAQLAYIVANAATGMPVVFTTAGGSTTVAVLNTVDGVAASAVNDQYKGRLLVFTDSTLKGVVTDITGYVGGTTTATITAIPTAPLSSHNARLI